MNSFIKDRKTLEDVLFQNDSIMKELDKRYDLIVQAKKDLWKAKREKSISREQIRSLKENVLKKQRSFVDCISKVDKDKSLIVYVEWYQFESFINELHSLLLGLNVANAVYKTH